MKFRAVLIAAWAIAACGAAAQPSELVGRWRVSAVLEASSITALDGAEAAKLVGQELVVSPAAVQFAGMSCKATFAKSQESARDMAADYGVNPKLLKLPDPATSYEAGCIDLFVRDAKTVVFTWKGYFFEASKPAPAR